MAQYRDLPLLAVLPVEKLVLHEYHDPQRSVPIAEAIQRSGILRNPPIVIPFHDGSDRYMVLDGANRTTAIQNLNIPHIVAQVVAPDDSGLQLTSWHHVIWDMPPNELLESFSTLSGVELIPFDGEAAPPHGKCHLAAFLHPDGRAFQLVTAQQRLIPRVEALNTIVDAYRHKAQLDRTQETNIETLRKLYPQLSGLLMLPAFRIDEVLQVVAAGHLMPPGSTRFVISPRVLHINYPLAHLRAEATLAEKNAALQEWVRESLARKGVRYYAEATYIFDD